MLSFCVIAVENKVLDFLSEWEEIEERENESYDECCVELFVVNSFYRVEVECEHSGDECCSVVECLYSEEYPTDDCQNECDYYAWCLADFVIYLLQS